jgi:hypothetical protein
MEADATLPEQAGDVGGEAVVSQPTAASPDDDADAVVDTKGSAGSSQQIIKYLKPYAPAAGAVFAGSLLLAFALRLLRAGSRKKSKGAKALFAEGQLVRVSMRPYKGHVRLQIQVSAALPASKVPTRHTPHHLFTPVTTGQPCSRPASRPQAQQQPSSCSAPPDIAC